MGGGARSPTLGDRPSNKPGRGLEEGKCTAGRGGGSFKLWGNANTERSPGTSTFLHPLSLVPAATHPPPQNTHFTGGSPEVASGNEVALRPISRPDREPRDEGRRRGPDSHLLEGLEGAWEDMQEGARTRQSGSGRKPDLSGRSAAAAPSPAPARLRQPPPSWSAPPSSRLSCRKQVLSPPPSPPGWFTAVSARFCVLLCDPR